MKEKNENLVTETTYNVSISGKIQFNDFNEIPYKTKGLYTNIVQLWFKNTNNPNISYHPVYSSSCQGVRNVHYDILDANGNYNFNFNFNGDLSNYNQIVIYVSRSNSAIYMPIQQDGIRVWCNNTYSDWFSLSESPVTTFDGTNPNITLTNFNKLINSGDGAIFRNMALSREFIVQRYNGSLTFSLPSIFVRRDDLPDNVAGWFISGGSGVIPRIEIDHNSTELTTTSHEFGHFVNYKMWNNFFISNDGCSDLGGNTVPGTGRIYKEGWAIFYSFAVRNYANKVYSDDIRFYDDNTEKAPFESPRFYNIRYTSVDPNISAYACYLWNLYDSYENSNFEANTFLGDNDDISGKSLLTFETMRTPIKDCASKFHNQFKNSISNDEKLSTNDIYSFMFENSNNLMRSAQVGNASIQVVSNNQINFNWLSNSYINYTGGYDYRNRENGYKIFRQSGSNWDLVSTIPFGANNYTLNTTQTWGNYKLTAYNSSGESSNSFSVNLPVVAPIISNFTQSPNPLYKGSNGSVTCNLSQGNGNLNFNWSIVSGNTGFSISNTNSQTVSIHYNNTDAIEKTIIENIYAPKGTPIEGPTGAVLKCKVWNSAGSDSSNVFINLATAPHGCPFVYTWNGENWVEDNNILPQSQDPDLLGEDVTDFYQLYSKPVLEDDKYYLAMGEFDEEISYLDQLKLLVVDHPQETFITVDDNGEIIQFAKPAYFANAQLDSIDVYKKLIGLDSIKAEVSINDTLKLSFEGVSVGTEKWLLLIGQQQPIYKDKIAGSIFRRNGSAIGGGKENTAEFSSFRLRKNPTYQWVLVPDGNSSSLQVDIAFKSEAEIDYTELSHKLELPFTVYTPQLLYAEHSVFGDVTSLLNQIDGQYSVLNTDEMITLEYSAPPINEGMERTFIFVSRGRYERLENRMLTKGKSNTENKNQHTTSTEKTNIVYEYGLSQNYPNPFNPVTTISYRIKEQGLVHLKVYNSLGQEIVTLVNEVQSPGNYESLFDASNLPSGVYIYSLRVNGFVQNNKMTFLK